MTGVQTCALPISKNTETTVTTYQAFDSKYFYMFGTTYYLNLYFRF